MLKPTTDLKNVHVVTKRQWGAFYGTDLDLQLRRRGIDAMTAAAKEEHDYVCNYIFPKIGKIRRSEEIILSLK